MIENFFKSRREQLDLTQRAIAQGLQMTDSAVSAWEREVAAPSIADADRLSIVYRVTEAKMRTEIALLSKRIADTKQAAHAG